MVFKWLNIRFRDLCVVKYLFCQGFGEEVAGIGDDVAVVSAISLCCDDDSVW